MQKFKYSEAKKKYFKKTFTYSDSQRWNSLSKK